MNEEKKQRGRNHRVNRKMREMKERKRENEWDSEKEGDTSPQNIIFNFV